MRKVTRGTNTLKYNEHLSPNSTQRQQQDSNVSKKIPPQIKGRVLCGWIYKQLGPTATKADQQTINEVNLKLNQVLDIKLAKRTNINRSAMKSSSTALQPNQLQLDPQIAQTSNLT